VSAASPRAVFGALLLALPAWAALAWLGLPLRGSPGDEAARAAAEGTERDAVRAEAPATPEEPVATVVVELDPEPDPESESFLLPYEGDGRRMRVPVTLGGPNGTLDTWFLFDTGATFTTVNRATLDRLGLATSGGPELTLNTANGPISTSLVLLDRIVLQGEAVDGVSAAICDDCSGPEYAGLLGLNVTGRYRTAIDHDAREVELSPLPVDDRTVDVTRWLELSGRARTYPGLKTEVEVSGRNLSRRRILEAVATVSCRTGEFAVQLDDIPPRGDATTRIDLPSAQDCESFRLQLLSARW